MGRRYPVTFEQQSISAVQDLFQINGASEQSAAGISSIGAAGSGYAVGDLIILAGGIYTRPVVLVVSSLSGSGVTGVTIRERGSYSTTPGNAVAQGSSSGAGTGATFNLTWYTRNKALKIIRQKIECADPTLPAAQFLALRARLLGGTVTGGSGGGTPNYGRDDEGDSYPTFTALANNTAKASTTGMSDVKFEGGFHVFDGHEHMYESDVIVLVGEAFVFELLSAPSEAIKFSGGMVVEEIG